MERQKKIIDASIIVKWFIVEEKTIEALKIQEEHIQNKIDLIVPEITFIEVINALKYKKKSDKDLFEANSYLWNFQFHVEKTNQFIVDKAIELSIKYNLTIYDGMYAALAQIHGCELITADEKLSKIPQGRKL